MDMQQFQSELAKAASSVHAGARPDMQIAVIATEYDDYGKSHLSTHLYDVTKVYADDQIIFIYSDDFIAPQGEDLRIREI